MTWHDFLVDRKLGHEEVALGVAQMFGVDVPRVAMSDDIAEAESARVNCTIRYVDGEFRTVVEVFVGDECLARLPAILTIARFAETVGCTCLVSDDTVNPYSWILVDSTGQSRPVLLGAEELDDHERYVVRR